MLSNQEKVLEFSKSIERELNGQIAQIDKDIEQYKQSETQKIEDEVFGDCYRMIQSAVSKIKLEVTAKRSQRLSELKKGLLLKRDEYVNLIFSDVRGKLLDFTASADYPAFFKEKLKKAKDTYQLTAPRIQVREQDLALKGVITEIFPGCTVEASGNVTIGGFILEEPEKGYIVNESLDNILAEQKTWFYSHSGLRITQF